MKRTPLGSHATGALVLALALSVSTGCSSGTRDVADLSSTRAQERAPATRTDLDLASERARLWLTANAETLPAYVFLVTDFLGRRFGTELPDGGDLVARADAQDPASSPQMRVYARLVDPAVVITPDAVVSLDGVDAITGPALACDQVPLPADYAGLLQRAIDAGRHERTHAVLALQWLREQGCIDAVEAAGLAADWSESLVATVVEERASGGGADDLAVEAMTMLAYGGHGHLVQPEWVADVLSAQGPDGAWPASPAGSQASPHTTVLALWLLLELAHPEAAPTAWVPQP